MRQEITEILKEFTTRENTIKAIKEFVNYHVLQAKIEENESILRMLKLYGNAKNRLPINVRLSELREQLEKYEK